MSCQLPSTKSRGALRTEAAAKRRRPRSRKAPAAKTQVKRKKPPVVDLTGEKQAQKPGEQGEADARMDNPKQLESDDYFEVLNLPRAASEADVKRAYRKLAVQWHPDKNRANPRAEEFFKKISEAYEVLSDPEKRKMYEKYGKDGVDGTAQQDADVHFGFGGHAFSTQHARDIFDAFFGGADPFEALFRGGRQRRSSSQRRGGFGDDPFESMGFGGMGMNMRGFGNMGGMSMMDSFFSDGFGGMDGAGGGVFSTSTSSSSSTFTDRNGHVIMQKTTTTTGADGRTETVTEEYRNGKLVNSTSSSSTSGSRLADAGRMQLEGSSAKPTQSSRSQSYQRRGSSNSRPKY
ncbi:unnamed protein product [Phytophthora lilii]|uniref:Unnamed protein product n=1 Tax=Phytophthora lilii TaxID=2077276 RepID=A0A9W6TEW3_9STRA|nr:unnamed protein product [Phytophthora lilii]